jgi:hypothetical protein
MANYTPLRAQNELKSKIPAFHDRARAARDAFYTARKEILNNDRLSPGAQHDDIAKLTEKVSNELKAIREEQERYVAGLKSTIEKELRGDQPSDANSVLLRRDAADRVRKLDDEKDALTVLADAIHNGDTTLQHAIGHIGRQKAWVNVRDAYQAAQPETADVAMALAYVEDATSDVGYRLGNQMAYADPTA